MAGKCDFEIQYVNRVAVLVGLYLDTRTSAGVSKVAEFIRDLYVKHMRLFRRYAYSG